jgi:hypothetical protein
MKMPNMITTRNHEFQICFALVDENTKFQPCLPEVNASNSSMESSTHHTPHRTRAELVNVFIPFLWNLETGSLETGCGSGWSSS